MFEVVATDLAGRIGKIKTKSGSFETPCVLPVVHPVKQIIAPKKMAKMGVSAVIVPEIYQKYFRERTIYGSKFWKSGIIKRSPNFDKLVAGGGTTFNFPFSQSIVGVNASEVLSDSSGLTVYGTTTTKQIARRLERGTAYSVNDLAKIDAG